MAAALETAPIPAYLFRAEGDEFHLVSANAAARAQNPLLASLIGRPMAFLYQDQPELLEDVRRAVADKTTVVREMAVRRHDRLEANQHLRLVFTFVEPNLLAVYSQDLAEPSALSAALRESEERYRSLIASLPDAFVIWDRNGVVLSGNQAAAELVGRKSIAELIGQSALVPPGATMEGADGTSVSEEMRLSKRTQLTGTPERGLFRFVTADGAVKWLRSSAAPIRGSNGEIIGATSITADETDRVRAEQEALASAEKLRMAFEAAQMGMFSWEPARDRGEWSRSTTERFRVPHLPDVDPGFEGFVRRVHADDRERALRLNAELMASPDGTRFEHELRIAGDDGVTRWARIHGRVESKGGDVRIRGMIMDVTERRRLEEELERSQRLESIGRLAGGLAHDFNNMLGAMLTALELLEPHVAPAGREDHQTIRHAAERARELTAQLLAFARRRPIQRTSFDLAALARTIEPLLRRLVGPACELRITAPDAAWILGDAAQIEQCIVNLVANARDAGGPIDVIVRPEMRDGAPRASLDVIDRGPGMDEATRAHAFDPFFTTKSAGTGLGLASTYGVVRQHEGEVEIESAPGAGTRVRISLPAIPAEASKPEVRATPANRLSGTVLVIDDEPLMRSATRRLLASLGLEAHTAANLDEASAVVRAHPLAAVVCDIAMPSMMGPEVVSRLREIVPDLPVVFVSGYSEIELTPAITRSTFLPKPYTREQLAECLRRLIAG